MAENGTKKRFLRSYGPEISGVKALGIPNAIALPALAVF